MKVLAQLCLLASITVGCSALQCYVCEDISGEEGGCGDIDGKGELTTCPEDKARGCYISTMVKEGKTETLRGCSAVTDEARYKCDEHFTSTMSFRFCNCHGDSCNEDFDTAGGPQLSCYQCSSAVDNATNCGEAAPADNFKKACPYDQRKGCSISKTTIRDEIVYTRECSNLADPSLYKCDNGHNGITTMKYCNCHGDNCNRDWDAAAAPSGSDASHLTASLFVFGIIVAHFV